MMKEPRFSSTESLVMRGIWKSSTSGSCLLFFHWRAQARRQGRRETGNYLEYSSTMSCSCTGVVISRRSGLRSTLAVSES